MLESKRKATIFLSIAFLLALVAGFLFYQEVRSMKTELGGVTEVYVAAGNIPSRTLLQDDNIKTMEIPNRFVTDSHVKKKEELLNKVSVVPLSTDDLITKNMIKPVSNVAKENNRLVVIYRNQKVTFDQEVEALDRVDIVVSHDFEGKPKTGVFMKDVPVAMVAKSKDKPLSAIAVEIPAEMAPKLIHMENYSQYMRILKANVGKGQVKEAAEKKQEEQKKQPEPKQQKEQQQQQKPEQKTEQQPKQQNTKQEADPKSNGGGDGS